METEDQGYHELRGYVMEAARIVVLAPRGPKRRMGVSVNSGWQDQLSVRLTEPARMGGWSISTITSTYDLDTAYFMGV